jgi:RNA polymerase sigma factor for flagellar operon FliA
MDARLSMEAGVYAATPQRGDEADRLVRSHLGMVRRIAWHVHGRMSSAIDIEDLMQIGMVALIEAARTFEDRGQAAFATYATMRVRGAMIDQLRKGATVVRSAMRKRREWEAERNRLATELGRAPRDDEMAARLGLELEAYHAALAAQQTTHIENIDDVYSDSSAWFADDAPDAHDQLERSRLQAAIAAGVKLLPEREAMVLQLYFVEELNLEEIGQVLGVGAARVCQIKKAALDRLRGRLRGWEAD